MDIAVLPSTYKKEMDLGSLWTWTVPLWGVFVLVLFLAGVIMEPQVLQGIRNARMPRASAPSTTST